MANEPQKIDGGIFIDTKTGDIVHDVPEEGIQIVPPGGFLDDVAKGRLAAEGGDVPAVVGQRLETASAASSVETAEDPEKTVKSQAKKGE